MIFTIVMLGTIAVSIFAIVMNWNRKEEWE